MGYNVLGYIREYVARDPMLFHIRLLYINFMQAIEFYFSVLVIAAFAKIGLVAVSPLFKSINYAPYGKKKAGWIRKKAL